MELGGDALSLMFQRQPGLPNRVYVVSAWVKGPSGGGAGFLKLEFHDEGAEGISEYNVPVEGGQDWADYRVRHVSPFETAFVTASIVGSAGGSVQFDDVSLVLEALTETVPVRPLIREILGSTHVGGDYNLGNTEKDFLNQGADALLELGTEVVKVWFHKPHESYPFNSDWPESFPSLVAMAQHPYFLEFLNKPFKHYILMTYRPGLYEHYWINGITEAQKAEEEAALYEFSKYLMETYWGTGKTFVIQHWEGDWAARGGFDADTPPTQTAFDGMIGWLNARQAGVNRARAEMAGSDVPVYHAAEVNLVKRAMDEGQPNVTNMVLPHTNLDLVSYSSYDTEWSPSDFLRALDYIAEHTPDSEAFGARNVYVGEYGIPENDNSAADVEKVIKNVVETALEWRCPYIIYWEVFCNEERRLPVVTNEDSRGFWLIRPDGTHAWAYGYLQELMYTYDADLDGIPDTDEGDADPDGDGFPNHVDRDSDGDGVMDDLDSLATHSADQDKDRVIAKGELLRVIQLFTAGTYGCDETTEDGYGPGVTAQDCGRHDSDYSVQDWQIDLSEILRLIQLYNADRYNTCDDSEDGFCPWPIL
jgi:hypothetical protein